MSQLYGDTASTLKQYRAALVLEQECEESFTHEKLQLLIKRRLAVKDITVTEVSFDDSLDYVVSVKWTGGPLKNFTFKTGDLVNLVEYKSCQNYLEDNDSSNTMATILISGVISITNNSVTLVTNQIQKEHLEVFEKNADLVIVKRNDDAAMRAMQKALSDAMDSEERPVGVITSQKGIQLSIDKKIGWPQLDPLLNDSQKEAVSRALASELTVIHGPPGTGKTSVIIEILRQLHKSGAKVLVCSSSNLAVDNVAIRLMQFIPKSKMIRLGNSPKIDKNCLKVSSKYVVQNSPEVSGARTEANVLLDRARGSALFEHWEKLKAFLKYTKGLEDDVMAKKTAAADLVLSTLHGSSLIEKYNKNLPNEENIKFDALVIDEISQALYPQCLIPLTSVSGFSKIIVAGDNKQLPPVVKTEVKWAKTLLLKTTFDWLMETYGDMPCCFLNIQYRMNSDIMRFPSEEFYNGKLVAHHSVANRTLSDLGLAKPLPISNVVMIDTKGTCVENDKFSKGKSIVNLAEAAVVKRNVQHLLDLGVPSGHIGVISPYKQQVAKLQELLPNIECSTIDGYQGREQEVIVLSLVRSNQGRRVGFLADTRRLNVAITRPKRLLLIIGDQDSLRSNSCYRRWFDHLESCGCIHINETPLDCKAIVDSKATTDLATLITRLEL